MRYRVRWAILASALGLAACAQSIPKPDPTESSDLWGEQVRGDLRFIEKTILAHHPGPVFQNDPSFTQRMLESFGAALGASTEVHSWKGSYFLLRKTINALQDGHLAVAMLLIPKRLEVKSDPIISRWPGFEVRYQPGFELFAGRFYVSNVLEGKAEQEGAPLARAPQVDDELLSCDGISTQQILKERVLPYFGNSEIEGDWAVAAPFLLRDVQNPWFKPFESCRLSSGGYEFDVAMNYEDSGDSTKSLQDLAPQFRTQQDRWGTWWMSAPHFGPQMNATEKSQLDRAVKNSVAIKPGSRVVFDLRNNPGGDTEWVNYWLKNILTEAQIQAYRLRKAGIPSYRVSFANLEHWRGVVARQKRDFGQSDYFERVVNQMEEGLKSSKNLIAVAPFIEAAKIDLRANSIHSKFKSVFVLVDSACVSTCLSTVDLLVDVFKAKIIGQPTRADSVYMDTRSVELPSGLANLILPLKVYQGRARANNQPYRPEKKYFWNHNIKDSTALEKWISGLPY